MAQAISIFVNTFLERHDSMFDIYTFWGVSLAPGAAKQKYRSFQASLAAAAPQEAIGLPQALDVDGLRRAGKR